MLLFCCRLDEEPSFLFTAGYGKQCFFLLINFTSKSITGTSVNTPTVQARTTGEVGPNIANATATDNSKKSEAAIRAEGAAML